MKMTKEEKEYYRKIEKDKNDSFKNAKLCKTKRGISGDCRPKHFDDIIGGTVSDIGFVITDEGGMAIDFTKNGRKRRIVFGYTELGIWVKWSGEIK